MSSRENSQKWKTLRRRFLDSLTDNRCAGCGEAVDLSLSGMNPKGPTVDHIKSVKHFPELEFEPSNLQLMCRTCNMSKHAGPRSREKTTTAPVVKQRRYPGQQRYMRYDELLNTYVDTGNVAWSDETYLVTFSPTGEIIDAVKGGS